MARLRSSWLTRLAGLVLAWGLVPAWADAPVRPSRIVSLNLCTDQLLLQLVPRERIAGLEPMAIDPVYSAEAGNARGLTIIRPELEAVLALHPDLVLAAEFSDPYLVSRLQQAGIRVTRFAIPTDFAGTLQFIDAVAAAVGEPARGERMAAALAARWQALGEEAKRRPARRVLLYRPGGVTMGANTLEDTVMRQAGLVNVAREMGLAQWSQLSVEAVLVAHPGLLLLDDDGPGSHSVSESVGEHPALRAQGIAQRKVPHGYWICPGPALADGVAWLMGAAP